jgi:hypothetical protein
MVPTLACGKALNLLKRNPKEAWKYRRALIELQACATASPTQLAQQMYGEDDAA